MNFVDKILDFFGLAWKQTQPASEPAASQVKIIAPEHSAEFYSKINIKRLDDIEKKMLLLALTVDKLAGEIKSDREFLVHIATLHEELLNQLDQGKVVMVRQAQPESSSENSSSQSQATMFDPKKKFDIN